MDKFIILQIQIGPFFLHKSIAVPVRWSVLGHGKTDQVGGSENLTPGNIHGLASKRVRTPLSSSIRWVQEKTQYLSSNFAVVDTLTERGTATNLL